MFGSRSLWGRAASYVVLLGLATALTSCNLFSRSGVEDSGSNQYLPRSKPIDDPYARIGAKQHPKLVAANGGEYKNQMLESKLARVVDDLVTHSDRPARKYQVTILNTPEINAFALPGGYLYVTRGLLALANDSSEIAAVLSHEMAHVTANHGIERKKRADASVISARVLTDVVTNPVAGKVAKADSDQRLAQFSRNQELQADALGIKLLGKSGYDAYAAGRFLAGMRRFAEYRNSVSAAEDTQNFLSTHPSTPKRVELASRHARFFGPPGTGRRDSEEYLEALDGILYGDTEQEGFVRGRRFSHKGLGIQFDVPGGFTIDNKAEAVLASGPGETAVRFDAVSRPPSVSLEDYLQSGWINGFDPKSLEKGRSAGGLETARGSARAGDWAFDITVIRVGSQIYRFIVAAPRTTQNLSVTAQQITNSFKLLSRQEVARLRPLKIKIRRVRPGDTVGGLARRMRGTPDREKAFRVLNGIVNVADLSGRRFVKLITD